MRRELTETLARAREPLGLTQGEVADRIGIQRPSFSKLERGLVDTTARTLEKWAAICGYRVELVRESDTILSTPGLTAEHRALVDRLTRLLPEMKEAHVEMLEDMVDAAERRKGRDR